MTYYKLWYGIPTRRSFYRFAYLPTRVKGKWVWLKRYKVVQKLVFDAEDFYWK